MNFKEKLLSNKTIYDGKIVHLDKEIVQLPNGNKASREIVHHQGAVAVIVITDQNKIVMIRQWREPLKKITLEIPAGKIEPEEHNTPEKTAWRELNEETRLTAKRLELVTQFYTSPGFADELMYVYHAVDVAPVSEKLPQDEDEFLELVELSPKEVQDAIDRGEICDAKTIMAVMLWQMME